DAWAAAGAPAVAALAGALGLLLAVAGVRLRALAGALAGFERRRRFGGGARVCRFGVAAAAALGDRGDPQEGECSEECAHQGIVRIAHKDLLSGRLLREFPLHPKRERVDAALETEARGRFRKRLLVHQGPQLSRRIARARVLFVV